MKSSDLVVVSTFRSTPDVPITQGILDEADRVHDPADDAVRTEDALQAGEALNRRHQPSNCTSVSDNYLIHSKV